ncbi:MAG: hypothetical protein C0497_04185 [Gemmatimonas sp.]|nr:hypothetical protein [Gemmatimonas sp.]
MPPLSIAVAAAPEGGFLATVSWDKTQPAPLGGCVHRYRTNPRGMGLWRADSSGSQWEQVAVESDFVADSLPTMRRQLARLLGVT